MAALTQERKIIQYDDKSAVDLLVAPVAASTKIYAGALVALNASGNAVPASAATGLQIWGVAQATVDNSAGIAGALTVTVRQGIYLFNVGTSADAIVQANVGQDCYAIDDNTVGATNGGATPRSRAGRVVYIDPASSNAFVAIGPQYNPSAAASTAGALQSGSTALVAGTATVTAAITATSRILVTRKTQGGTVTNTVQYTADGTRTVGSSGSFVLNAEVAAGTVNASDTSTVDWLVIG